ncbi:hypothetical protein F1D05_28055 [Kribbella qitaiheensis]|uniref:Uncharacterized protein n=1 Tax=Kribbella qitaiheensis TaxID=1544730 RepID=A0A7G6X494_9ACTN|nr:hypothetical protein [Kribbella qitaiheensis]QNE21059.1 hypothetical protein F1D05_28055 [Kribbella qitaiheensis]
MSETFRLLIAAVAVVSVAYLVNQFPPLKGSVSKAALAISRRSNISPAISMGIIYFALAALAVGGTLLASGMTSSSAPTSSGSPSPSKSVVIPGNGSLTVEPKQGPAGTSVFVSAQGFAANETVRIEIFNGARIKDFQGPYIVTDARANPGGEISIEATIPDELCCPTGSVRVRATGKMSKTTAESSFTLT